MKYLSFYVLCFILGINIGISLRIFNELKNTKKYIDVKIEKVYFKKGYYLRFTGKDFEIILDELDFNKSSAVDFYMHNPCIYKKDSASMKRKTLL